MWPRAIALVVAVALVCVGEGMLLLSGEGRRDVRLVRSGQRLYVDCSRRQEGDGSAYRPWNQLADVNKVVLAAGDSVLLRRGTQCRGFLAPRGSGRQGRPIVLGAFGTGSLPRIDAGGLSADSVRLADESWIVVEQLELTNRGDYRSDRRGMHVIAEHVGAVHDIVIRNLFIHDVDGADHKNAGGSGGIQIDLPSRNVLIEDNLVQDVNRSGIWVTGTGQPPRPPDTELWPSASTGIVIRANTILRVGGDGIVPTATLNAIVADNVVCCGNLRGRAPYQYDSGIWTFDSNRTLIEHNEVFGMRNARADGTGYDLDHNQDGTILQDNYGYDNAGGFVLLTTTNQRRTAEVRFNLSVNEYVFDVSAGGLPRSSRGTLDGVRVYNNTFTTPTSRIRRDSAFASSVLPEPGNLEFVNNILDVTRRQSGRFPCGRRCTHNLFFGVPPSGQDAVEGDPRFVDAGKRGNGRRRVGAGFKLQPTSPAIGAGVPVIANATSDYFGYPLGLPVAIGFHQPPRG